MLDEEYDVDVSAKELVEYNLVSDLIRRDMHLEGGEEQFELAPGEFAPARNTLTLSKLVLLDANEIDDLVVAKGISSTIYGESLYPPSAVDSIDARSAPFERGFNAFLGAVRNIDGNHQWEEFAPPYLRASGPIDCETGKLTRHFGHGLLFRPRGLPGGRTPALARLSGAHRRVPRAVRGTACAGARGERRRPAAAGGGHRRGGVPGAGVRAAPERRGAEPRDRDSADLRRRSARRVERVGVLLRPERARDAAPLVVSRRVRKAGRGRLPRCAPLRSHATDLSGGLPAGLAAPPAARCHRERRNDEHRFPARRRRWQKPSRRRCDPRRWNADQGDGDRDGVGDACDNSPAIANRGQEDFDLVRYISADFEAVSALSRWDFTTRDGESRGRDGDCFWSGELAADPGTGGQGLLLTAFGEGDCVEPSVEVRLRHPIGSPRGPVDSMRLALRVHFERVRGAGALHAIVREAADPETGIAFVFAAEPPVGRRGIRVAEGDAESFGLPVGAEFVAEFRRPPRGALELLLAATSGYRDGKVIVRVDDIELLPRAATASAM